MQVSPSHPHDFFLARDRPYSYYLPIVGRHVMSSFGRNNTRKIVYYRLHFGVSMCCQVRVP